jgi:hypothetical protein
MNYEIPREMFKQRLEDRLNFVFVDLLPEDSTPVKFENVVHINYSSNFKTEFAAKYPKQHPLKLIRKYHHKTEQTGY